MLTAEEQMEIAVLRKHGESIRPVSRGTVNPRACHRKKVVPLCGSMSGSSSWPYKIPANRSPFLDGKCKTIVGWSTSGTLVIYTPARVPLISLFGSNWLSQRLQREAKQSPRLDLWLSSTTSYHSAVPQVVRDARWVSAIIVTPGPNSAPTSKRTTRSRIVAILAVSGGTLNIRASVSVSGLS